MEEIIAWLTRVEDRAFNIYDKAREVLAHDRSLASLLKLLCQDEKMHSNAMKRIGETIREEGWCPPSVVRLGEQTREKILGRFDAIEERLKAGTLGRKDMVECIVDTEFSEWNDIFLYVVNSMKERHAEFVPVAAKIQQHKKKIERFLTAAPEFREYLESIRRMPDVWYDSILVVDDEELIAIALKEILFEEGAVDSARNGKEGLRMLSEKYYSVVISDMHMPVMNGMEFYKKASGQYPDLKERFLFFTTAPEPPTIAFFKEKGVKYLEKPAEMSDIKEAVIDILTKGTPEAH